MKNKNEENILYSYNENVILILPMILILPKGDALRWCYYSGLLYEAGVCALNVVCTYLSHVHVVQSLAYIQMFIWAIVIAVMQMVR